METANDNQTKMQLEEFRKKFESDLTAFKKEQDRQIRLEGIDASAQNQQQLIKLRKGEIVKQRTQAYEDRITELSKSYRDKSSPEYRNELKRVVSELRKDIGPEGVFGIAAKNREVEEKLKENAPVGSDLL